MLEESTSLLSTTAKDLIKMGEDVLAHSVKHSKDSVEQACLCKLLFLTIWVAMFAVCLAIAI